MMLQILESGQALYALAAVCALGILARLTARTLYKRLIRETDNMALTKNRYLREFKQKAENTYRLNQGIANTQVYLEKQLSTYRFLGVSLNGWANLAGQMTLMCFLLGGAGSFLAYWYRCDTYYIVLYAVIGILTGLLTMVLDLGVNLSEKHARLICVLQDYLENSLWCRLARETAATEEGPRAVSRDSIRDSGPADRDIRERDGGRDTADRDANGREPSGSGLRGGIRSIARNSRGAESGRTAEGIRLADDDRMEENSRSGAGGGRDTGGDRGPDFSNDARPLNRSLRRNERAARKSSLRAVEDEPAAEGGRPAPEELRRSLEQIAASREKSRMDGEWLKALSPDELDLVGEILKQYLE